MGAKKRKMSAIWGILFAYLAISKVFYWFNIIIVALNQGDLRAMGEVVFTRLFTQDMLIILGILLVLYIEKFVQLKISLNNKTLKQIIEHIIIFLLLNGVFIFYFWAMNMFLGNNPSLNLGSNLIYGGIIYLVLAVVFEVKKYLKKKEMTGYMSILNVDEKLDMLKALLESNILTQEEFDRKKEKLQHLHMK